MAYPELAAAHVLTLGGLAQLLAPPKHIILLICCPIRTKNSRLARPARPAAAGDSLLFCPSRDHGCKRDGRPRLSPIVRERAYGASTCAPPAVVVADVTAVPAAGQAGPARWRDVCRRSATLYAVHYDALQYALLTRVQTGPTHPIPLMSSLPALVRGRRSRKSTPVAPRYAANAQHATSPTRTRRPFRQGRVLENRAAASRACSEPRRRLRAPPNSLQAPRNAKRARARVRVVADPTRARQHVVRSGWRRRCQLSARAHDSPVGLRRHASHRALRQRGSPSRPFSLAV
eukprot:364971-Chlamydomonas_euryale.AAC.5